ncbi:hypothetical protein BX070DRAFT_154772 [Coemansia spiralis]|nr:hypothetical protein BX070DRAFT_154772 [Coemansia spiralis]
MSLCTLSIAAVLFKLLIFLFYFCPHCFFFTTLSAICHRSRVLHALLASAAYPPPVFIFFYSFFYYSPVSLVILF